MASVAIIELGKIGSEKSATFQELMAVLVRNNGNILKNKEEIAQLWNGKFGKNLTLKLSPEEERAVEARRKKEEERRKAKEEEDLAVENQFNELVKCTQEVYDGTAKLHLKSGKKSVPWTQKRKIISILLNRKQMIRQDGELVNFANEPSTLSGGLQGIQSIIESSVRKLLANGSPANISPVCIQIPPIQIEDISNTEQITQIRINQAEAAILEQQNSLIALRQEQQMQLQRKAEQ